MLNEEVVISGIGGYFPRSRNLEEFKQILLNNEIALDSRWGEGEMGVTNKIGIVPSISEFDTSFFGIHRQQCSFMDPMQRVMLERTFEALIDAGVNPQEIKGKKIACYMGSSIGENDNLFYESVASGFGVTGHSRAMLPNRISYWLNLKGPSCAVDFNWVNGVHVLKLAYNAIKSGECDSVIVGTTNLAINPEISWNYKDMGVLSDDASSKCFDSGACGYARSDGVISMLVQKASIAKRAYASILAVDSTFNGSSSGTFLNPDPSCLENFIQNFYEENEIDPKCIDYVECYGCGVKATDEMELNTLDKVLCKNREGPLLVGSVIPNTGNSEASAGLFSVCKAIIAMETETIPATLQYSEPNPNIPALIDGRIKVVTKNTKWNGDIIAVNSIGISSAFGHLILKRNNKVKKVVDDDLPRLAVLSSRTEEGISKSIDILTKQKNYDVEFLNMVQGIYSQSIPGHMHRGYGIVDKSGVVISEHEHYTGIKRPVWFVYSGMGSQWIKMGSGLMGLPMFADSIKKSHAALAPHNVDLIDIITTEDKHIFDNILHSFVGIAAIQIALTDILYALGIIPEGIIGHSVGELGCAYADGSLTAEQMILSAYYRGKASLDAVLIKGMMAAIGLGYNQLKDRCPEAIEIACHNSASSCTISGPAEDVAAFVKQLQDEGIFARMVNVSNIAYHSRYIKPAAPFLLNYLTQLIKDPKERSKKWICTSIPEAQWETDLAKTVSAEYLTNNLLSSVLFEEGSLFIPKDAIAIEIAPHGLLQAILKKSLKTGCFNVPLTQRGHANSIQFLMSAVGKLHLAGLDVSASKIHPPIEYPVSRGTPSVSVLADWDHSDVWKTGNESKLNMMNSTLHIRIGQNDEHRYYYDHKISGKTIVCFSSYLATLIKILNVNFSSEVTNMVFENLYFHDYVEIPQNEQASYICILQKGTGNFEINSNDKLILTGNASVPEAGKNYFYKIFDHDSSEGVVLKEEDIYKEFEHRGHSYKDTFRKIKEINIYKEGSEALFHDKSNFQMYLEGMIQQILLHKGEIYQNSTSLKKIQRINICLDEISKTACDVKSTYDFQTDIAHMQGLQIVGVTTTTLPQIEKLISFEEFQTINLDNCVCENFEKALNIAINIALSNYAIVSNKINIIDVSNENNQSKKKQIDRVIAEYKTLVATIKSCRVDKINVSLGNVPILIVFDGELNKELKSVLVQTDAFLLVKSGGKEFIKKDITTMLTFNINGEIYNILRKATESTYSLVYASSNELSVKDIMEPQEQWAKHMSKQLNCLRRTEDLYLVIKCLPKEGIRTFVNILRKQEQFERLKYLFVLDDKHENINNGLHKAILRRYVLTILQNGCSTVTSSSIEFVNTDNYEQKKDEKTNSLESIYKYSYISLNKNCIEYSTIKGATNTLGIAYYKQEKNELYEDPIYQWNAPMSIYKEEGCGLPEIYVKAYYLLKIKANIKPGQSVLFDCGFSHLAMIGAYLTTDWLCPTFIIVETEEEKKEMINILNSSMATVLVSKGLKFENELPNYNGVRKIDTVITNRYGSTLNTLLRLTALGGKFIMLDPKALGSIGSNRFLANISACGVNLDEVFLCDKDTKIMLHALVKDGIDKKVLNALPVHKYNFDNFDKPVHKASAKPIIKVSKSADKFLSKQAKFARTAARGFILIGDDWSIITRMSECLVYQGALSIVVIAQTELQPQYLRRIKTLKTHFNVKFYHVFKTIEDDRAASEVLTSLLKDVKVDTVMFLPNISTSNKNVRHLEMAFRITSPNIRIINFDAPSIGVFQLRKNNGFPACIVQWDDGISFNDIIPKIAHVLKFCGTDLLIKSNENKDAEKETWQMVDKRLDLLLPKSIDEFDKEISNSPTQAELVQIPTEARPVIRELPSIILVPGISNFDSIRQFAKRFTFPAFYAQLPSDFKKVKEVAAIYAKQIECLHPSGPYNILGISCGGILAIEISKILECRGSTQLFLIDGTPEAIQASLKFLGGAREGDVNLLIRLLGITANENTNTLMDQPNWESLVNETIKNCKEHDRGKQSSVKHALNYVKDYIEDLKNYNPPTLSTTAVLLLKPSETAGDEKATSVSSFGLNKFCKKVPIICKFRNDHKPILTNLEVVDLINTKVTVI